MIRLHLDTTKKKGKVNIMANIGSDSEVTTMQYKPKGANRFETDIVVIGITRNAGTYTITLIEKATNKLAMKQYRKKEAINNFTEKYGIRIKF